MHEPTAPSTPLPVPILDAEDGRSLTRLALTVLRARLLGEAAPEDQSPPPSLTRPGATFVTLERSGTLRGCIGTTHASQSLYADVAHNTRRAMRDPRLSPVRAEEWTTLDVTVAVLTQPEILPIFSVPELVTALRPGIDGLLVTDGRRRATFLPAVWEKLRTPEQFVTALWAKGGWNAGEWPAQLRVRRYTTMNFHDRSPRDPLR